MNCCRCMVSALAVAIGVAAALADGRAEGAEGAPPDAPNLQQESNKIVEEREGLFVLGAKPKQKVVVGSRVIFVRMEDGDLQILARGMVAGLQNDKIYVELEGDSVVKAPMKGDLALAIAAPWVPDPSDPEQKTEPPLEVEEPSNPGDPGYLELNYGFLDGSLQSTSDNQANSLKSPDSFNFPYLHFAWYFEFAWRLGIEFERFSGTFPTFTYDREAGESSQDVSSVYLNLRTRKMFWDTLRPTFRLVSMTDQFSTTNTDEYVLSSVYSGTGFGLRLGFEFTSNIWKTDSYLPFAINQIYVDANYFPTIDAKDETILRGASASGSSAQEWRLGVTFLMYLKWMPLIKRYTIEVMHGQKKYDLSFQGPTVSEEGGPYTIPENGHYGETVQYTLISIGVRFEDAIGRFFMPR